jgi:hypothetical protein
MVSEGKRLHILSILAAAIVLGLPTLLYGPLVDGHDTYEHLNFTRHFGEQFWGGEAYPRWLIGMNHGLGSPTYFVFPPLPAYVYALLQFAAKIPHFNAFNVATFLPLLCSGLCAFLWLGTMANKQIATLGAVSYMLMPYHLVIDFYRRCAIPECWAFVWMPLVLYFTVRVTNRKPRAFAGLAIAFALMIYSHLVTLAIFFPIPLAVAYLQSPAGRKAISVIRVFLALGLGVGVSAVYLFSALVNAKYIPASRLVSRKFYQIPNQILDFGKGLFISTTGDAWVHFLQTVSWAVLSTGVFTAVCAFVALKTTSRDEKKIVVFWIAVCCFATLMMTKLSSPIWIHFHKLREAVQFPWRFNALLCLGSTGLFALCLSNMPRNWSRTVFALLALIGVSWWFAYVHVWPEYRVAVPPAPPNEQHLISEHDGWLLSWLADGTNQRSSLIASQGPQARFKEGDGTVQVITWKARHIDLSTDSDTGGWIMINQFYYPTWNAQAIGKTSPLDVRVSLPEGLLEIKVPPGKQEIKVEIPRSRAELWGMWLSALCTLICIFLCLNFTHPPIAQV